MMSIVNTDTTINSQQVNDHPQNPYNKNKIISDEFVAPRRAFIGPKIHFVCIFCKKRKPALDYSDWQLQKKGPKRCIECTGNISKELKCSICDKNLPLDDFSKTQRRLGSRVARCKKCVKKCEEDDVWDSESNTSDDD